MTTDDKPTTDQIAAALERYHELRDDRDETGELLRTVSGEVRELHSEVSNLTTRLENLRNRRDQFSTFEKRNYKLEREVEADLTRARNLYQRKMARRDELQARARALRELVDRAEQFLTSNGASIADLEAGYARAAPTNINPSAYAAAQGYHPET